MLKARVDINLSDLIDLRDRKVRRGLTIGIRRAGKPVRLAVVAEAERIKDKGYLSKSIGTKYGYKKNGDKGISSVWGVIGPRRKYTRKKGKFKRGPRKGEAKVFRPSRYAHLQEWGSKRTKRNKFLEPALGRTIANYRKTFSDIVRAELQKVK